VNGQLMGTKTSVEPLMEFLVHLFKTVINYHLGDLSLALEMAEKCRSSSPLLRTGVLGNYFAFYDAMTCLAIARNSPNRRLISIARRQLKKLQVFSTHNKSDGLHVVHLIEAEFAVLVGNRESAMPQYYKAISIAQEEKFLHVQALACERAALTLEEFEPFDSRTYLDRAIQTYKEWGAHAKADQLRRQIESQ
jgi:hypothetical protein